MLSGVQTEWIHVLHSVHIKVSLDLSYGKYVAKKSEIGWWEPCDKWV